MRKEVVDHFLPPRDASCTRRNASLFALLYSTLCRSSDDVSVVYAIPFFVFSYPCLSFLFMINKYLPLYGSIYVCSSFFALEKKKKKAGDAFLCVVHTLGPFVLLVFWSFGASCIFYYICVRGERREKRASPCFYCIFEKIPIFLVVLLLFWIFLS